MKKTRIFYRTTLLRFIIYLVIFLNQLEISLQIQNKLCKSDLEENLNEHQNGEPLQDKECQVVYLNEMINSSDKNKNSLCDRNHRNYHNHGPLRPPLLLSQSKNFVSILNQSKWVFLYSMKQRYRQVSNKTTAKSATVQENLASNFENFEIQNAVDQSVEGQGGHHLHSHQNQSQENLLGLRETILSFSQPFDASVNPESSAECRNHTAMYIKAVENMEIWALKMLDSSARLGSGILNGNINQLGDFDQCLAIQQQPSNAFHGQYCLAYIQPHLLSAESSPQLHKKLFQLIQSYEAFKSHINDPGHRVPRFSLINWGICIPSSCTAKDVEYSLDIQLKNLAKRIGGGVHLQIKVESEMCQTQKPLILDSYTIVAIGFFAFMVIISLLSTLYDCAVRKQSQNEWLTVFSLKRNSSSLFNTSSRSTDDITVIHGIRFFNALMLLLAHKSLAIFFVPYINRTQMSEILGQSWTVIGRAASLYTDPFLLFSGVLASYSIIGKLQRNEKFRTKDEYLARFLRIVPPLAALILFCTFVLPLLSTGPQWNLVIGHHAVLCKKYWWRNLLFVHNYFGFANMCLTHTHHLGIDTQLFIVTPFMVLALWKWPKKTFYFLMTLAGLATFARFYTTINNELSNYVYFGTTIQRLFKTADYMYSFPPYRSTIYIFGLLLGYILRVYKGKQLTKIQLRFGWIISVTCCIVAFLGPAKMGDINYKYNPWHAAFYAAFAPIGWCSCFAWIVFVSHRGHKNFITKLLSWKGFQITTKLSYAIYLTQFPVFFFNVGRRRHLDYFRFIPLMLNFNELIWIILCSIMLTLLFDIPFQNIKRILLKKTSGKDDHQSQKSTFNQKKEAVD